MNLPPLYGVTPDPSSSPDSLTFLHGFARMLGAGVRLAQLRAHSFDTDPDAYIDLLERAQAISRAHGARLIANAPPGAVARAASIAPGVHLGSAALMACAARPVPRSVLFSAACHDLAQLQKAQALHADFVTLSPVLDTATHPEARALGWTRFAALASGVRIPVYALGGMEPAMLEVARAHGAHGIAAIRALWPG